MLNIISGGAGFIGTNFLKTVNKCEKWLVIDNLKLGTLDNIKSYLLHPNIKFLNLDLANVSSVEFLNEAIGEEDIGAIWHFAANSDISSGVENIEVDYNDTFLTTLNLVRLAKLRGNVNLFCFASSSAVYGDHGLKPIYENTAPLRPISNYGSFKLASEAVILGSVGSALNSCQIFRFPNVIGTPATHGVIFDFIKKLKADYSILQVLGNGTQSKSYLHVSELVEAMNYIVQNSDEVSGIYNIGNTEDSISVREIAERVVAKMNPDASIIYGNTEYGWQGDIPKFEFNCRKLAKLGFTPKLGSKEAVAMAIDEILLQENING